ncbi:MAG: S8 family serine peptidase [Clostridia bacterium]|nr:S8 family serine peptidase [Clostridia bacterium]
MKNTVRRLLAVVMAAFMVFSLSGAVFALEGPETDHAPIQAKKAVSYDLSGIRNGNTFDVGENTNVEIAADQIVPIMVKLQDAPAVKAVGNTRAAAPYAASLKAKQDAAAELIRSTFGVEVRVLANYTHLFNGFAFEGEYRLVEELNRMEGMTAFVAPAWDVPETQIANAGDMVSVSDAYELGYTGKGYAIAIVDTGLKVDHPAFSTDPEDPAFTKDDIAALIDGGTLFGGDAMDADTVYYSAKIPFRWNYYTNTYNVAHTRSDHGTHVAGIAAGNGGEIVGMAKDAQIFALQVFSPTGGASWIQILSALEDCAKLGVNAANLSLGSPAGFAYYTDIWVSNTACYSSQVIEEVFECLHDAGVTLSMSAGNEYSTALGNYWAASSNSIGYALVQNPDYGVTGSPGSFPRSLSVASIDNAKENLLYIKNADGEKIPYSETDYSQPTLASTFPDKEVEYVAVPGFGTEADYADIDVTGKIALIKRGSTSFSEKALTAQAKGAVGVVIYNNQDGVINMNLSDAQGKLTIPAVSIMKQFGDPLAAKGTGTLYISATAEDIDSPTGNLPSTFSSWGTTSDLAIKPEIAGVGGNIYSSTDSAISGEDYQSWSGTSMSSPQVGGSMLIVRGYVDEMFPDASETEKAELIDTLLMCTANPVYDEDGSFAAVRKQGAGLVDLLGATTTTAYVSVPGCVRPKLELGDDPQKTGEYEMTFSITNFGETNLSYVVNPHVLIDDIQAIAIDPDGNYVIAYTQTSFDISDYCEFDTPDVVRVNAGETVEVTITVTLTDDIASYIDYYYTAGAYVEGFIELTAVGGTILGDVDDDGEITAADALLVMRYALEIIDLEHPEAADVNGDGTVDLVDALLILRYAMDIVQNFAADENAEGVDLNIPFLAFYGDWNYNAVLNTGFYYEDFSYSITPDLNYVGAGEYGLGINPYVGTSNYSYYSDKRNAISPNDDGFIDTIDTVKLGFLRNAGVAGIKLLDENGNELEDLGSDIDWRKDYYSTSNGYYTNMGQYFVPDIDYTAYAGKTVQIMFYAYLANDGARTTNAFDPEDNAFCEWIVPVYVDVTAPTLQVVSFTDGKLTVKASDDHFVSFVGALDGTTNEDQFYVSSIIDATGVFEEEAGKTTQVVLDLGEEDRAQEAETLCYVAVADYAGNEVLYVFNGTELIPFNNNFSHPDFTVPYVQFYGYARSETVNDNSGNSYRPWLTFNSVEMKNENYSFTTNLFDALPVDYTILCAALAGNEVYCILKYGTTSYLAKYNSSWELGMIGAVDTGDYAAHEMAYNPVTGKLYIVSGAGNLMELDKTTGEILSTVSIQYGAVAIDFFAGYCIIVDIYGYVSILDVTSGQELGDIAYTGIRPVSSSGSFYPQCGAIHNGVFYWASIPNPISAMTDLHMIAIDLMTGTVGDAGPVFGGIQFTGMFVTEVPAA